MNRKGEVADWLQPSHNEIAGSVGTDLLLGRSDQAVVYLSRLASYADALRFDMLAAVRPEGTTELPNLALLSDIGEPPNEVPLSREFLRFGVEFADGRNVSNLDEDELDGTSEVALWQLTGESDGAYSRYEWYLWPLPDKGDLTFICDWPAFGISESRVTLGGAEVRLAARRARNIWDPYLK